MKQIQFLGMVKKIIVLSTIIALFVNSGFASPPIQSHLFLFPSIKISYEFGKTSGFEMGGSVGIYYLSNWMISGINAGADYNFKQKDFGFNQTIVLGNPYAGGKIGGYLNLRRYLPQAGVYVGYVFCFLEYDFTFFTNTSKLGAFGIAPIYLKGLY